MKRNVFPSLLLLPLLILGGCMANTKLTGVWKDSDYRGRITNVLVIGVSKQETTRRLFENRFAESLAMRPRRVATRPCPPARGSRGAGRTR